MVSLIDICKTFSQIVHGTLDTLATPVQDMGVDHRGFNIFEAQQFLNRSDVVTALKQMGGERMAEGVACGTFGQIGFPHRAVDCLLDDRFVNVMPSFV